MFKIFEEFIEDAKNVKKVKYAGALSGITGLFLTINSTIPQAKTALSYIQLFWLVLLTFALTSLFISFTNFVWTRDKKFFNFYDIPLDGVLTMFVGIILFWIVISLWTYMVSTYTELFSVFIIKVGFPALITLLVVSINIWVKKKEKRLPLLFVFFVNSLTMGTLIGTAGFYLQGAIVELYYFCWFYEITPLVSLILFICFVTLGICKKINLFKPHVSIQR